MKTSILALCVLLSTLVACSGEELDATLTIRNNSSFTILEINLSPVDAEDFGPDLLGADLLEPGDVLEITGIECDDYDIRILDEDTDECILPNIELCFEDAEWVIDDVELALCVF